MAEPAEAEGVELGLQIEFVGFADVELAFESLPREASGIELLNVRRSDGATYATVFVPEGKLGRFEKLIQDYLSERRGAKNQALDHRRLIDTIREIRGASLRALWTDEPGDFPAVDDQPLWWEVWLPIRRDRIATVNAFRALAGAQGIRVGADTIEFPERTVVLALGTPDQLKGSAMLLGLIAELRRARETAEFFDTLPLAEQREWVQDLLSRLAVSPAGPQVPHVCILDTGVNAGHPLLASVLTQEDLHSVEPGWGTGDTHGHGTEMAGVAFLGNLVRALETQSPVQVNHRLESVKLLRRDGDNDGTAELHGHLTAEAVSRPEVTAPDRPRVFALAISSKDGRNRGRPSAWSAAVDGLAADAAGEGARPRLLVVCAGNVQDSFDWLRYPDSNSTDSIHDPGQAWNALTIGASTELITIADGDSEGYHPIAAAGGLSPFSTTSQSWQKQWPLKPDIVFEGGNAAQDAQGASTMASLSLLTTHYRHLERPFTTTWATSAATAGVAGMAAELMAGYPLLRPESIRALVVHSARWTDEMRRMHLPIGREGNKADYERLVRHCGFGVPSLSRAMWSASDALTMVIEKQLNPFTRVGTNDATLRDIQFHQLPWPRDELEALGAHPVNMRVTLSYFIEPNPSARGLRSRYRYESHGLRFDVQRPEESLANFRARMNRAARDEEEGTPIAGEDPNWLVGKQGRHRGSLHSDIWRGRAVDLASRGVLAVYPALGWWKTRTKLERYDKAAPYSLVISIEAPDVPIDLYAAVATRVATMVPVRV